MHARERMEAMSSFVITVANSADGRRSRLMGLCAPESEEDLAIFPLCQTELRQGNKLS